jgi:hypothetical protein
MGTLEPGGRVVASFKGSALILASRDVVFESLATREHTPRWSPTLEEARETFEITGYEPPRRLTLAGHIGGLEAVVGYGVDELALGTLVTCHVQVDLTSVVLVADLRLAKGRIEAAISRSLDRLKRSLETERPS